MSRDFLPGELDELGERLKIEFGIDRLILTPPRSKSGCCNATQLIEGHRTRNMRSAKLGGIRRTRVSLLGRRHLFKGDATFKGLGRRKKPSSATANEECIRVKAGWQRWRRERTQACIENFVGAGE